ncbi:hypothetical protein G7Z17_g6000 [Cylindrodendrum hubeiense]|uniref:N-acetyltransferase domain-containing protein n=1 Tax=Cylindrodendrum hubeiense TaxID=595255 RepID=A0A9P5LH94_9HYPO|nr:hypothetical protein G7Z17_g6000 [Cylindrodendrum hubeiense]
MAYTVRLATLDDSTQIAKLGAHVFTVTFGHSVPPHELQAYLEETYSPLAVAAVLEDPQKNAHVAIDEDGNVLGFAILALGTTRACVENMENPVELQRIYVDTAVHGKGVGWMLADSIEKKARKQGFRSIWLSVWEENQSAHKAYTKWGYKHVGDDDFIVGVVVQRDHIMLKAFQ